MNAPQRANTTQPQRGGPFGGGGGPWGAMGRPVEKAKNFRGTLVRLLRYVAPQRLRLMLVLVFAIASTLFSIVSPKIMGQATTKIFDGVLAHFRARALHAPAPGMDFAGIGGIIVLLLVLYAISALFSYVQQYIMAAIAQRTVYDLRQNVDAKLARLPLAFFDSRTHGEILSRVTNDIDNIASTLQQSLTQLLTSVVTLVGIIIMMFSISALLSGVTLVTLPLYIVITMFVAKRSQGYFMAQQRALGQLNGHVEEMYTGHTIVKAFGHEEDSIGAFTEINERLYGAAWRAQFVSGIIMPLTNMVSNLGYVLVSVIGGILVAKRQIAIGDVQAFIQYSRQFTWPIVQTANIANVIQSAIASAERVFELLDEQEQSADPTQPAILDAARGDVQVNHVDFRYEAATPLIEDMTIAAQTGQTVAIVGPTGAGKTTVVNLLMRFYELDAGSITVDGVDIRHLTRHRLHRLFGMVLQDTWLFNGTIHDNIAYGRDGATDDEIVHAARAAHADHFIRTLPDGYSTVLNEEASNLSQGQKQLLTIARAFLANPTILILDEATSSVDSRTEVLIQQAMATLMRGRTSFVIAHRLSTIRDADTILVMDKGRIVEQGTHQGLLDKRGFYAELYNSQFTGTGALAAPELVGQR